MTFHQIVSGSAERMTALGDASVQLVVTSPPYPMIAMWDAVFAEQNPEIARALQTFDGESAFEAMHAALDKVWREVRRILAPGGFVCVNIGDATRKLGENFALYPNHARIISAFAKLGFINLPPILWRKQTNAPNKFMGSGMLPAGAYVTLEHEWVLIFRKKGKRDFSSVEDKTRRKESAFFWEERNVWFSDVWDFKGMKQNLSQPETRKRSGAFPFELPYRLINMYSVKGDVVLDPFLGTGTTTFAALTAERNSVGYEIDPRLTEIILSNLENISPNTLNSYIEARLNRHQLFIENRKLNSEKKELKYFNSNLNIAVVTRQETEIKFAFIDKIEKTTPDTFHVLYQ